MAISEPLSVLANFLLCISRTTICDVPQTFWHGH